MVKQPKCSPATVPKSSLSVSKVMKAAAEKKSTKKFKNLPDVATLKGLNDIGGLAIQVYNALNLGGSSIQMVNRKLVHILYRCQIKGDHQISCFTNKNRTFVFPSKLKYERVVKSLRGWRKMDSSLDYTRRARVAPKGTFCDGEYSKYLSHIS